MITAGPFPCPPQEGIGKAHSYSILEGDTSATEPWISMKTLLPALHKQDVFDPQPEINCSVLVLGAVLSNQLGRHRK